MRTNNDSFKSFLNIKFRFTDQAPTRLSGLLIDSPLALRINMNKPLASVAEMCVG